MTKIMVVDDSLFMRNRIARLLTKQGYETIVAEDGVAAVDTYRRDRPDAVLMDITMPQKDGLSALTEIRQFDPQAIVVILTALNQKLAAARAIHLGAKDFLVKPAPPGQLIAAVQKALG